MAEPATLLLALLLGLVVAGLFAAVAMFIDGLRARAAAQRLARLAPPPRAGASAQARAAHHPAPGGQAR
jgi:hypothetical protein